MTKTFDFIVIGQGLTALATLYFLAKTPYQVLWLRSSAPSSTTSASFGEQRVTAISAASQVLLRRLLPAASWGLPLSHIQVSRAGQFGSVVLSADQAKLPALGYIIENQELGSILAQQQPENLTVVDLAHWQAHMTAEQVLVTVRLSQEKTNSEPAADSPQVQQRFSARALLLADGQSADLAAFLAEVDAAAARPAERGFSFSEIAQKVLPPLRQTAIVLQGESRGAMPKTASERFTRHGVLAALPISQSAETIKFSLVWSWRGDLPSREFSFWWEAIVEEFAGLLGTWQHFSPPVFYPLTPFCRRQVAFGRALLLGNAAQTLHPVAGQGFNLIVRDLATLRCLLSQTQAADDIPTLFQYYQKLRAADRFSTFAFTQLLSQVPMSGAVLFAVDNVEILRKIIEKQGLGWQYPLPPLPFLDEEFPLWR
jgi:2-octaprenyl-6-methoxyphenol hydroxylase